MRILIVDDQRSARRVLRQMLSTLPDVELTEASSVEEGVLAIDRYLDDLTTAADLVRAWVTAKHSAMA